MATRILKRRTALRQAISAACAVVDRLIEAEYYENEGAYQGSHLGKRATSDGSVSIYMSRLLIALDRVRGSK